MPIPNEQLKEIIAGQARIEAQLEAFHIELLGNGQPGRIQRIEEELEDHRLSLGVLKQKQSYIAGIGAALAFASASTQAILFGRAH